MTHKLQTIDILPLFPQLEEKFIELLQSLSEEEWQAQTIARLWKVKDVVAHLLDGNIRILSMLRDGHFSGGPEGDTYADLLKYLNQLNADWVQAFRRVSPQMLITLHQVTWSSYYEYYASLDPMGKAAFPVSWAGEEESKNWMHIAREYTEKFLHQQQIRDAVNRQGILNEKFFTPFASVCMLALPFTLHEDESNNDSVLEWRLTNEIDQSWKISKSSGSWQFVEVDSQKATSKIIMSGNTFWKLVSKSRRYKDLADDIKIEGETALALRALEMVSFMA
ncbi:maleylpyruvate isomerase N-terminal domain-containing protein [Roseivirga sp.]|uniref:maleylpyruvate isomerase N-terminal domain-containing protein n=1 Tax=Roseivirga sp. TaxID=1964215 RepID=UPI003B5301B5